MKGIILAAGSMLHREAPESGSWPKEPKPKTLYHVRGEVLLERQVRLLRKVGIKNIRVVVGYRKERVEQFVKKKGLKVRLIFCPEAVNDAKWHRSGDYGHGMDSIRAGLKRIDDDVIFVMGDVFTTRKNLQRIVQHPDELAIGMGADGNLHIFKVARKYLPKLRAYDYPKGIPLHKFIFKEKKVVFREKFNPMGKGAGTRAYKKALKVYRQAHKNWMRKNCLLVEGTFDVDHYKKTDEFKKRGVMMRLMVHSRSTEKYIKEWTHDKAILVQHHPTKEILKKANTERNVIAIGGGSVIDTAKILSRNPVIAIPTTFAGASRTSHAVYWHEGKKFNLDTRRPVTIMKPEYLETLPDDFYQYSRTDCICHAVESLISKKATEESDIYASVALELIKKGSREDDLAASLLAADAIEITGTNLLHALSYPLTAMYEVPHGKALLFLLPRILPYIEDVLQRDISIEKKVDVEVDTETVIVEALKYPKIFETVKPINKKILIKLLKEK